MIDVFGREITYLRLSVTDLCNLRCKYCMPETGIRKKSHEEMMTFKEMEEAVRIAASLGIKKVRITGGEPLVKKDIAKICEIIANISNVEEVCITTNGVLLEKYAKDLKNAGVSRVNISLDSLDREKYIQITGRDELENVMRGIDAALDAGFKKVKINTVLIGGFNDDELEDLAGLTIKKPLDVRFIELMPMNKEAHFDDGAFLTTDYALLKLEGLKKIDESRLLPDEKQSVAKLYKYDNALGRVGFISAVSNHFCSFCNRLRLTADGKLKPCLHSAAEINIKGLSREEIIEAFNRAVELKPNAHKDLSAGNFTESLRTMNCIGG